MRRNRGLLVSLAALATVAVLGGCSSSAGGTSSRVAAALATPYATDTSSPWYQVGQQLADAAVSDDGGSTGGMPAEEFCANLFFPISPLPADLAAIVDKLPSNSQSAEVQADYGCEAKAASSAP
jgi:hypothetical protein